MLNYFKEAKQAEIAALTAETPESRARVWQGQRPNFLRALQQQAEKAGIAVIAEHKRASPSLGEINMAAGPEEVAMAYAQAGATAISVLTEASKFKGDLSYLHTIHQATGGSIPLLRKDFLFDPLQIADTARTPAAALLLIVKLTPEASLVRALQEQTEALGMHTVVEVFDEHDLHIARAAGAKIIQVNARNLNTMHIDRSNALSLAQKERHKETALEFWIAASGIGEAAHVHDAHNAGFNAVLVGTSLMQGGDMHTALQRLTGL